MGRKRHTRLYLRGTTWWTWGFDSEGVRWSESTHQKDERAAEIAARDIERSHASATYTKRQKLTLEKALNTLREWQRQAKREPNTLRATEYHCRHLIAIIDPKMRLSDIRLEHTTNYLSARLDYGADRHTVRKEIGTLLQAMRRCAKKGMFVPVVDYSSLMPDEMGKVYTPRDRWLPPDEYALLYRRLGTTADHHRSTQDRRDYLAMYCFTGARKSELFDVLPEHYDEAAGELWIDGTKTDGASRLVPVNDVVAEILQRRIRALKDGEKLFPVWHTVCRDLERACAKVGIAPVTPNDLRRTFCTWLLEHGVPEATAAKLLGHADSTMVRRVYGKLSMKTMSDAVAKLKAPEAPKARLKVVK